MAVRRLEELVGLQAGGGTAIEAMLRPDTKAEAEHCQRGLDCQCMRQAEVDIQSSRAVLHHTALGAATAARLTGIDFRARTPRTIRPWVCELGRQMIRFWI